MKKFLPFLLIISCMQNQPDFDSLWDYQNPDQTEQKFREILDNIDEKKHPEYSAELKTQIARTLGLQQKFEEGHALLDEIEDSKMYNNIKVHVRYDLERGRLYNSDQKQDKALPYFTEAYELGTTYNHEYYAVDAAHMMAYALISKPQEKISWELNALQLVEKTKDERTKKWEGSLYNNLGWSYFDLKEYDNAITYFEKSKQFENSKGNDGKVRIAKWSIAKCERMKGNLDVALKSFQGLEQEIETQNLDPDGYVFEEIAECFLSLSDSVSAKPYFAKAYIELSKDGWMVKNESEKLDRMKELGE